MKPYEGGTDSDWVCRWANRFEAEERGMGGSEVLERPKRDRRAVRGVETVSVCCGISLMVEV